MRSAGTPGAARSPRLRTRGRPPAPPPGVYPAPGRRVFPPPPRGSPEAPKRAFSGVSPGGAQNGYFGAILPKFPHFGGFGLPGPRGPSGPPRGTAGPGSGALPGPPGSGPPSRRDWAATPAPYRGGGTHRRGWGRGGRRLRKVVTMIGCTAWCLLLVFLNWL